MRPQLAAATSNAKAPIASDRASSDAEQRLVDDFPRAGPRAAGPPDERERRRAQERRAQGGERAGSMMCGRERRSLLERALPVATGMVLGRMRFAASS
jgi:hypothetical protein